MHEQKEIEDALETAMAESDRPKKRRRGGEVGRDWACETDGCLKTFKSVSAFIKVPPELLFIMSRKRL